MTPSSTETLTQWLAEQLEDTERDWQRLHSRIMATYYEPLVAYARKLVAGTRLDAVELVAEFFDRQVTQDAYLERWRGSGFRLRSWLMNGLFLHLRSSRKLRRATLEIAAANGVVAGGESPLDALDRVFARNLVLRAEEDAREDCEERGLGMHWKIFQEHVRNHRSYADLGAAFGVTAKRAAVMARTGSKRFQAAVSAILIAGGTSPADVFEEICQLLRRLET